MGRSVLLEVLDRPVTSVIICILGAVWLRIHSVGADYQHVGASYDLVVHGKQVWRLLTAQLSHVSGLHLLFNCSSLWSMGYAEAQRGSVLYLSYTALFLVLSSVGIMGLYALAVNAFRREQDAHTLMVGYSCVVFAWMAYLATSAGATATYSLFGAVPIPANLMPLGALVFTSVIVPQASFVGHLSGLVAGYVMAFLPTVPSLLNLAVFICFLGVVFWSLHRQFGGSMYFERLRSYLPLRTSADDVELG